MRSSPVYDWKNLCGWILQSSANLLLLSETLSGIKEKKSLLSKAQSQIKEFISSVEELYPFFYQRISIGYYQLTLIQIGLASIESDNLKKISLLNQASNSIQKSIVLIKKKQKLLQMKKYRLSQ